MQLEIVTQTWMLTTNKKKQKIIAGTYAVMCGKEMVASKSFNEGYECLEVTIPAALVAKAEELDAEVKEAIVKSFEG